MKSKYSKDRLSFFLMPRIHGNVFAWNRQAPTPKSERGKHATKNIQRWEDDGGPVAEKSTPLPQVVETNTSQPMDASTGTD
jgi:hypothetical protein